MKQDNVLMTAKPNLKYNISDTWWGCLSDFQAESALIRPSSERFWISYQEQHNCPLLTIRFRLFKLWGLTNCWSLCWTLEELQFSSFVFHPRRPTRALKWSDYTRKYSAYLTSLRCWRFWRAVGLYFLLCENLLSVFWIDLTQLRHQKPSFLKILNSVHWLCMLLLLLSVKKNLRCKVYKTVAWLYFWRWESRNIRAFCLVGLLLLLLVSSSGWGKSEKLVQSELLSCPGVNRALL